MGSHEPFGVEEVLWLAIMHSAIGRAGENAALQGDLTYFLEREKSFDWNERLILPTVVHSARWPMPRSERASCGPCFGGGFLAVKKDVGVRLHLQ